MTKLHHVQWSRSFRVLWLLEEMGETYELAHYKIGDGSTGQGGLPAISPAMRVPALEIDGITMFESGAIVQYLCETRPGGFDRPVGHEDRPAFLNWIGYAETMASLIENLNLNHLFLRPPAKPSPVLIKILTARLRASLKGMEAQMGDHDYLLPSGFSGADAMLGFNLYAAPFFVDMDEFPKIAAYWARARQRPGFQKAAEREGPQTFYAKDFYPVPEE